MAFHSVLQYEEFASKVELKTQQLLHAHHYNSIGNFLRFYDEYCKAGKDVPLEEFYQSYQPPITPDHHTCVGLSLELFKSVVSLDDEFPGLRNSLFLASCEEEIEHLSNYCSFSPPAASSSEKEHVMLVMRIQIGSRAGFLTLDPGYHVSRVVTIMEDRLYPHTGLFTQSNCGRVKREYQYTLEEGGQYVVWMVRENRSRMVQEERNLIYVGRPYLCGLEVTEKRNLVYPFKSWLHRDTKGQLLAGLYFSTHLPENGGNGSFTLFYQKQDGRVQGKVSWDEVGSPDTQELIKEVGQRMALDRPERLATVLTKAANVLRDGQFLDQVLKMDHAISSLSAQN